MTKRANETQQLIITTNFKAKASKVENSQELKTKIKNRLNRKHQKTKTPTARMH